MGTKNLNSATDLITFTRASGGTALRKISYGNELVTNGDFATDISGWTSYNSVISWDAGLLKVDDSANAGSGSQAFQVVTLEVGKRYRLTGSYENSTASRLWIDNRSSNINIGNPTADFIQVFLPATTPSVDFAHTFVATATTTSIALEVDLSGTGYFDNISLKEVLFDQADGTLQLWNHSNNVPRIEYDATGAVKGLLIEEARTNLVINSNDLNASGWGKNDSTVTLNAGVSPDGTSNANKFIPNINSATHTTYVQLSLQNSASKHSFSVYVASAGYGFATVGLGSHYISNYYAVVIDLSNGTKTATYSYGTQTDKTCTVEAVGSFYRVTISGDGERYCIVGASDTGTYTPSLYGFKSFAGNGTSGILVYGAQVEAGAFPTSYIPTTGSTATRAADFAQIPTSAFGYNNDSGSLVIDVLTPVADQIMALAHFHTNSYLNSRSLWKSNPNLSGVGNQYVNDTYDGSITLYVVGQQTQAGYTKLGSSYGDSERAVKDGGTVASGTSRYPSPTRLFLGGRDNGYQSQCWIKSIQYYPRQLTDTQLQELTT